MPKIKKTQVYDYSDADGVLSHQVVRKDPKAFHQRRPDGRGGWIFDMEGVEPLPYRLPGILANPNLTVFVVEGEKDADALSELGIVATTNRGGAGKWQEGLSHYLAGRDVVIIPDNDDAGRKHAGDVAAKLHSDARRVRTLQLPDLPEKGDTSDWIAAGGTFEELYRLADEAPDYQPPVDPLADLIERVTADKAAAFADDVITALADLKQRDAGEYERLREELKAAGVRVMELDQSVRKAGGNKARSNRDLSQSELLLEHAKGADFFHAPDKTTYADIEVNGHRETYPIESKGLKDWLNLKFYKETGRAPTRDAMNAALATLDSVARFDGPEQSVNIRVAEHAGHIYVDPCDAIWRVVEIRPDGWSVIPDPPVRFRRSPGMQPLPLPERGGSIDQLKEFLNIRDDQFPLIIGALQGAFRGRGPYPLITLEGEQGSAKSTAARVLKRIVDPSSSPLRRLPGNERDLYVAATNGHLLAFDNVSGLSSWLSDAFATLSTGGGFTTRKLYTDQDETTFEAMRPVILNGIEGVVMRADLADRQLLFELPRLPDTSRRTEAEFWSEFDRALPGILGALFDSIAVGLARRPHVKLKSKPRMADFAHWTVACEGVEDPADSRFLSAYDTNRMEAILETLDADPVSAALQKFVADERQWEGKAADLLDKLTEIVSIAAERSPTWPRTPKGLSTRLRRAAPFLAKLGIAMTFFRRGADRIITISDTRSAENAMPFTDPSTAGENAHDAHHAHFSGRYRHSPGHSPSSALPGAKRSMIHRRTALELGYTATLRDLRQEPSAQASASTPDADKVETASSPLQQRARPQKLVRRTIV